MATVRNIVAIAFVSIVIAACGSDRSAKNGYFETKGLIAPESACQIKPSRIGLAEKIRNINEGNGCEIPNAWRVESIGTVSFSQSAIMNCGMAEPMKNWLDDMVQPAAQRTFGESVVSVDVAASYACRPRNNEWGSKMSEHGFGNAIDISAFTLESGRKVSVLAGWHGDSEERHFLRTVHNEACQEFRTVLGPESGSSHRDHFHLDLQARRSGGAYCR
jgi:hypothetical protein